MSLSVALQVAQSALAARQTESSVIARNIAGAQEPGFSKKSVQLSTMYTSSGQAGGLKVNGIARLSDSAFIRHFFHQRRSERLSKQSWTE
jgi:flagellar hook-associated protein 1 FlgK